MKFEGVSRSIIAPYLFQAVVVYEYGSIAALTTRRQLAVAACSELRTESFDFRVELSSAAPRF